MEQFMMYQKACHFHDEEIANDILHTDNVAEIKKLGRKVHGYDENVISYFFIMKAACFLIHHKLLH